MKRLRNVRRAQAMLLVLILAMSAIGIADEVEAIQLPEAEQTEVEAPAESEPPVEAEPTDSIEAEAAQEPEAPEGDASEDSPAPDGDAAPAEDGGAQQEPPVPAELTARLEQAGETALTVVTPEEFAGTLDYQWQKLDPAELAEADAEALWTDIDGANQAGFDAKAALGDGYFALRYRCKVQSGGGTLCAVTEEFSFPAPVIADAQDVAGEPEDEGDAPDIEDAEQPAEEAPHLTAALEVAGEAALTAVASASAELGEPAYQWQKLEDAAEYTQRVVDGDIAGADALWADIEGATRASFDAQAALGEGYFAYSYRCVVTAGELRAVTESHRFPEPEVEAVQAEPMAVVEDGDFFDNLQAADGSDCQDSLDGKHNWKMEIAYPADSYDTVGKLQGHYWKCADCGADSKTVPHEEFIEEESIHQSTGELIRISVKCPVCGYKCYHNGAENETATAKGTASFDNIEEKFSYIPGVKVRNGDYLAPLGVELGMLKSQGYSSSRYHLSVEIRYKQYKNCTSCGLHSDSEHHAFVSYYNILVSDEDDENEYILTPKKHSLVDSGDAKHTYTCSCGYACSHEPGLSADKFKLVSGKYKCSICGYVCKHDWGFTLDEGQEKCNVCGYVCNHPSAQYKTDVYPRFEDYISDSAVYSEEELEEIRTHLSYAYRDSQRHTVRATEVGSAKYCGVCGKLISVVGRYSDGEQPVVTLRTEPHQLNEDGVCELCGENKDLGAFCQHNGKHSKQIVSGEFWVNTNAGAEYPANTYHILSVGKSYVYDEYCDECGSLIASGVNATAEEEMPFVHDFVIGKDGIKYCRLCNRYYDLCVSEESCDHPAESLQISIRQTRDGADYVDVGDLKQHMRVSPGGKYLVYCKKCNKNVPELETEYSRMDPLDIYRSGAIIDDLMEDHNFPSVSDSKYCPSCDGNYGCAHSGDPVRQRVLATEIPSLGSATYVSLDKDWHAIHTSYYDKLYCLYCGEYLGMEPAKDESGNVLGDVTLLERHSYNSYANDGEPKIGAKCSICGDTYCSHPSWIRVYDDKSGITSSDDFDHFIPSGTEYHLVCADCGATGKTGLTTVGEKTEPHRFDDSGKCEVCPYQKDNSDCNHNLPEDGNGSTLELRALYLSDYGAEYKPERMSFVSVDDLNHRLVAARALRGYVCTVCGGHFLSEYDETVYNVDELQPHVLDANGTCKYCGYPGLRFSVPGVKLGVGESYTPALDGASLPGGGQLGAIRYTSGNTKVFKVTDAATGTIQAVAKGSASLKCSIEQPDGTVLTGYMSVTVVEKTPTSMSLSSSELTLGEYQSATLTALFKPAGAYANVTWTSSDPKRVTVDGGRVEALQNAYYKFESSESGGPVTITASALDGKRIARCTVNVLPYPSDYTMYMDLGSGRLNSDATVELSQGDSVQAKALVQAGSDYLTMGASQVTFRSTERKFATVSASGEIRILPAASSPQLPEEGHSFTVTAVAYNGATTSVDIKILPAATGIRVGLGTISPEKDVTATTVGVGQTFDIAAQLLNGENAMSGAVKFAVDKSTIVQIVRQTSPGSPCTCEFKALKVGTAKITAAAVSSGSVKKTVTVTVKKAPTSIELSSADHEIVNGVLTLGQGETATVSAAISPKDAYGVIELVGDYAENAYIDVAKDSTASKLTLTAKSQTTNPVPVEFRIKGNASVPTAKFYVEVLPAPAEEDLKLEVGKTVLGVNETAQVKFGYAKPGVAWKQQFELVEDSSSDPVKKPTATFNEKTGVLTAKNQGKVKLRMTAGSASVEQQITVSSAPTKVALTLPRTALGVGEKIEVAAGDIALTPSGSMGEVTLTSGKPGVVSVEKTDTGWTLRALAAGSAKITAKTYNGKASAKTITVKAAPTDIALSPSELTLAAGESAQLTVTLTPKNCGGAVEWDYDEAQVKIDPVPKKTNVFTVTALGNSGDVVITAKIYDSLFENEYIPAKATVHLKQKATAANINDITVDKSVLGVGETAHLTANFALGFSKQVTWKVAEASPAGCVKITNQATGEIQGVKVASTKEAGTAKLVAVVDGAESTASVEVKVVGKPTKVEFETKVSKLGVGEKFTLKIKPTGYNPQNVAGAPQIHSFSSSDSNVLDVNSTTGEIEAKATGKATITLKTYNKSAKMTVTVAEGLKGKDFAIADSLTLAKGDSVNLKADLGGGYANLTWPTTAEINQPGITIKKLSNEEIKITADAKKAVAGNINLNVNAAGYGATHTVALHIVEKYTDKLTVNPPAKSVIGVNEKLTLSAKGAGTISWKIVEQSPSGCVTVNSSGVVTGKKIGTAKIAAVAAKDANNADVMSEPVEITVIAAPSSLTSDKSFTKLGVGEKQTLTLTMAGYTAEAEGVVPNMTGVITATSSNAGVVELDTTELVTGNKVTLTAVKPGKSTVTIKTYNNKSVRMVIQVQAGLPEDFSERIIPETLSIARGDKLTLKANLGGGYANLDWGLSPVTEEATEVATGVTMTPVSKSNDSVTIAAAKDAAGSYTLTVRADGYAAKTEECAITVVEPPMSSIYTSELGMAVEFAKPAIGVSEKTTASVSYEPGFAGSVTWTSKNTKIATVNKTTGEVTGKKAGTVTIVATSFDSTKDVKRTAEAEIEIVPAPTKVSFVNPAATLYLGEEYDLAIELAGYTAEVEEDAPFALYSFTSSKPAVIEVTDARRGEIRANANAKLGDSAVITVKTYNNKKATLTIRIGETPVSMELPKALEGGLTLDRGQTYRLSVIGKTEGGRNCVVHPEWSVNNDYATIDKDGTLTALLQTEGEPVPVTANLTIPDSGSGSKTISKSFNLTIKAVPVADGPASNMELAVPKTTLGKGETVVASFGFTPDSGLEAAQMAYTLESSNPAILDVRRQITEAEAVAMAIEMPLDIAPDSDLYELVPGTKTGKVTLTATALENGAQQKIDMQVGSDPTGITIKRNGASVNGKTIQVNVGEEVNLDIELPGYSGVPNGNTVSWSLENVYAERWVHDNTHSPRYSGSYVFSEPYKSEATDEPLTSWSRAANAPGFMMLTFRTYNGKEASVTIDALPAPYKNYDEADCVKGITLTADQVRYDVLPGEKVQFTASIDEGFRWTKGLQYVVEGPATITQSGLMTVDKEAQNGDLIAVGVVPVDFPEKLPEVIGDRSYNKNDYWDYYDGLFAKSETYTVCTPLTEDMTDLALVVLRKVLYPDNDDVITEGVPEDPHDYIFQIGEGEATEAYVTYNWSQDDPDAESIYIGGAVTWSSSNPGVVKVIDKKSGKIQGVSEGYADIIATYANGVKITGKVRVMPPPVRAEISLRDPGCVSDEAEDLNGRIGTDNCAQILVKLFDENGNRTEGGYTIISTHPDSFTVFRLRAEESCDYCGTSHAVKTIPGRNGWNQDGWFVHANGVWTLGDGEEEAKMMITVVTQNGVIGSYAFTEITPQE